MRSITILACAFAATASAIVAAPAAAEDICQNFGPQAPRDISNPAGTNPVVFAAAPAAAAMNLCNIHTHTNAEHKGPDFSQSAGDGEHGGWQCNATKSLTPAELKPPPESSRKFHGIKPGDTLEVHWVYSSCDVKPGKGLEACSTATCKKPVLRVESQVFLVVNDAKALNFADYDYSAAAPGAKQQPKALPAGTGTPVVFAGSTTGDQYTMSKCSPAEVTWSVRPLCAKIDINTLDKWAASNVFKEDHSHDVRKLVVAPQMLAPIKATQ
jgi:hypothetical protein